MNESQYKILLESPDKFFSTGKDIFQMCNRPRDGGIVSPIFDNCDDDATIVTLHKAFSNSIIVPHTSFDRYNETECLFPEPLTSPKIKKESSTKKFVKLTENVIKAFQGDGGRDPTDEVSHFTAKTFSKSSARKNRSGRDITEIEIFMPTVDAEGDCLIPPKYDHPIVKRFGKIVENGMKNRNKEISQMNDINLKYNKSSYSLNKLFRDSTRKLQKLKRSTTVTSFKEKLTEKPGSDKSNPRKPVALNCPVVAIVPQPPSKPNPKEKKKDPKEKDFPKTDFVSAVKVGAITPKTNLNTSPVLKSKKSKHHTTRRITKPVRNLKVECKNSETPMEKPSMKQKNVLFENSKESHTKRYSYISMFEDKVESFRKKSQEELAHKKELLQLISSPPPSNRKGSVSPSSCNRTAQTARPKPARKAIVSKPSSLKKSGSVSSDISDSEKWTGPSQIITETGRKRLLKILKNRS